MVNDVVAPLLSPSSTTADYVVDSFRRYAGSKKKLLGTAYERLLRLDKEYYANMLLNIMAKREGIYLNKNAKAKIYEKVKFEKGVSGFMDRVFNKEGFEKEFDRLSTFYSKVDTRFNRVGPLFIKSDASSFTNKYGGIFNLPKDKANKLQII